MFYNDSWISHLHGDSYLPSELSVQLPNISFQTFESTSTLQERTMKRMTKLIQKDQAPFLSVSDQIGRDNQNLFHQINTETILPFHWMSKISVFVLILAIASFAMSSYLMCRICCFSTLVTRSQQAMLLLPTETPQAFASELPAQNYQAGLLLQILSGLLTVYLSYKLLRLLLKLFDNVRKHINLSHEGCGKLYILLMNSQDSVQIEVCSVSVDMLSRVTFSEGDDALFHIERHLIFPHLRIHWNSVRLVTSVPCLNIELPDTIGFS